MDAPSKKSEVLELRQALREVRSQLSNAQNQLEDASSTLHAIQNGSVDAVVTIDQETGRTKVLNLRSSEHPYRIFVETVSEGALTVNTNGISIFCNRHFSEIMHTTPGKILGKSIFEFFPDNERSTVKYILEKGANERIQQEIALKTFDEKLLQVQLSVAPVKSEDLEGICILVSDLSERHRAAAALHRAMERARMVEKLQAALELRDEFLSIASHELKTPVTSLMMQLQMTKRLLDGLRESPNYDRFSSAVQVCLRQGQRLITLIEDLLDVSQLEAGQLKLHPEQTNLSQLARSILDRFQHECDRFGCSYELDPQIEGFWDPVRLEQVFINLLTNAIKYGSQKNIHITVRKLDEEVALLEVKDLGIGIPEEVQPQIFNRFVRAVPSKNISGFGLGLYISKQIVESHGGSIRFESKPGQGTTFIVELPFRPQFGSKKEKSA